MWKETFRIEAHSQSLNRLNYVKELKKTMRIAPEKQVQFARVLYLCNSNFNIN